MPHYRRKNSDIEARLVTEIDLADVADWCRGTAIFSDPMRIEFSHDNPNFEDDWIDEAYIGDYICKHGSAVYILSRDDLETYYEPL